MPVAWPTRFPAAQRRSYQGQAQTPFEETDFPSSTKRRRIEADTRQDFDLEFVFTGEQFRYFWSWLKHKANEGVDAMDIPLREGDQVNTKTVWLRAGSIQWVMLGDRFRLRMTVFLENFTTPSEAALDLWLVS